MNRMVILHECSSRMIVHGGHYWRFQPMEQVSVLIWLHGQMPRLSRQVDLRWLHVLVPTHKDGRDAWAESCQTPTTPDKTRVLFAPWLYRASTVTYPGYHKSSLCHSLQTREIDQVCASCLCFCLACSLLTFLPNSGCNRSKRVQMGRPKNNDAGDCPVVAWGILRYGIKKIAVYIRSRESFGVGESRPHWWLA